jgi:N6-adenosine-specific RNA methylase IME4
VTNPQPQQSIFGDQDVRTVVIDPPWMERGGGKIQRGADRHYPLLPTDDIPRVIQSCEHWSRLADTAHCYLWVTNNFLPDGLRVMEAIGFRYITNIVWAKRQFGLGYYFRGQHELALFGVRGDFVPTDGTWTTVLEQGLVDHPRDARGTRIHSAKPPEFYNMVETASPGLYLDIFARRPRKGWLTWGNEMCDEESNDGI